MFDIEAEHGQSWEQAGFDGAASWPDSRAHGPAQSLAAAATAPLSDVERQDLLRGAQDAAMQLVAWHMASAHEPTPGQDVLAAGDRALRAACRLLACAFEQGVKHREIEQLRTCTIACMRRLRAAGWAMHGRAMP